MPRKLLQRLVRLNAEIAGKALLACLHFHFLRSTVLPFLGFHMGIFQILQSQSKLQDHPTYYANRLQAVTVTADCFPDDAAIGLLDRNASLRRERMNLRAAVVEVAFHRDPRSRSMLFWHSLMPRCPRRGLAVLGDVGMKVVLLAQSGTAREDRGKPWFFLCLSAWPLWPATQLWHASAAHDPIHRP